MTESAERCAKSGCYRLRNEQIHTCDCHGSSVDADHDGHHAFVPPTPPTAAQAGTPCVHCKDPDAAMGGLAALRGWSLPSRWKRATGEDEPYAHRSASGDVITHGGCPCRYVEPCDPSCTCVTPVSSFGCLRCCSYGSREQRKAMALKLTAHPILDDAMVERIAVAMHEHFACCDNKAVCDELPAAHDVIRKAVKETRP